MYQVLIVDDESIERKGIQSLLSNWISMLTCHLAANGEVALQMIKAGLHPDILITDVRMPFMDGLQLIEAVRKMGFDDTQIVICSAYDEFTYAKQALRFGVSEYLLKPLEPDEFYQLIDTFITKLDKLHASSAHNTAADSQEPVASDSSQIYLYRKICKILQEHYNEDLSIERIAHMVAHSASHISRIFADETGETIVKYLTRIRMEKAAELLRTTSIRVAEISSMVGYATPTYFGQVFRKTYNMTPNTYRERYGQ